MNYEDEIIKLVCSVPLNEWDGMQTKINGVDVRLNYTGREYEIIIKNVVVLAEHEPKGQIPNTPLGILCMTLFEMCLEERANMEN